MQPVNFKTPSTVDGVDLNCYRWEPEGDVRATLQISHGMIEHILRYSDFATFLASNGIAVYGHDHLGHGGTSPDDRGTIADDDGDEHLVDDLFEVTKVVEGEHPGIPHILLGHSMGSFVLRRYLTRYGDHLSGAIIVGTGQQSGAKLAMGKLIARLQMMLHGPRHVVGMLNRMALSDNDKFFDEPDLPNRWLSRDEESVRMYNEDPLCRFEFTASGFRDLFTLIARLRKEEGFENIPKDLPILMLSGADDPVGEFTKGVERAMDGLEKHGLDPILILYEGARHEILNETNRQEVYEDIMMWVDAVVSQ